MPTRALLTQSLKTFLGEDSPQGAIVDFGIHDIKSRITEGFPQLEGQIGANLLIPFTHFGLIVEFQQETALTAFDEAFILKQNLKSLIAEFGVIIIRNVRLNNSRPADYQKNIFPDLKFHVDRGPQFDNQYSLFYRNPTDPDHQPPRSTSTLIAPTPVIRLQGLKEGLDTGNCHILQSLFVKESPAEAIGEYFLEQPWSARRGTGEICIFDNRTVMHASYHRDGKGYKIAVQYLL